MAHRPYILPAIASMLIGVVTTIVGFDSFHHFTTVGTPTIHHKFVAVVVSQGRTLLMEGSSMPHGFRWSRRVQVGPAFQRTGTEFAGFGYGRSIEGSYVMFPLWFVTLLPFSTAFCFQRFRLKRLKRGFEVIDTAEPGRLMSIQPAPALPAARRRRRS